jgi:hypothetical protein
VGCETNLAYKEGTLCIDYSLSNTDSSSKVRLEC